MFYVRNILDQITEKYRGYKYNKVRTCHEEVCEIYYISCFTLCRKYNSNFLNSGSFAKATKIKILNFETFPSVEAAMGKSNHCRCSTK